MDNSAHVAPKFQSDLKPLADHAARIYCPHFRAAHCPVNALLDAMTRFAAPDVYQCPNCSGYLLWAGLMSFNTYGITTSWSDGAAPLTGILDSCSVSCCPSCSAVLWKSDLEALGVLPDEPRPIGRLTRMLAGWNGDKHGHLRAEREWKELPDEWKVAERGKWVDYHVLQHALTNKVAANHGRELFLRRRMWWATNNHIRLHSDGSRVTEVPVAPEEDRRANMLRMIEIHEAAGSGLAERAELLRQLGRFDDAIRLLTSGAAEIRASTTAAWTLGWAKAGDAEVKRFD